MLYGNSARGVFGSVAEDVIRRGDGPIVLVGPSVNGAGRQPFEELIVCLDGSPLADAILSVAMLLARDLELAVWLISVIDPAVPVDVDASSGEDVSESARLQRLARDLESAGVSVNWEVLHERDPASSIARFAGTRPSPLLALTTHGRGGLSRLTAGSVAMSVVHKAECPVVVTRSGHLSD